MSRSCDCPFITPSCLFGSWNTCFGLKRLYHVFKSDFGQRIRAKTKQKGKSVSPFETKEEICSMPSHDTSEYSKHYIVEALFKLMKEKDFQQISVTEITRKAGVGRVTFYRNFASKESVIIYYFNKESAKFLMDNPHSPSSPEEYYRVIIHVLEGSKKNKDLFDKIIECHLEYIYLDYLNQNFAADFQSKSVVDNKYLPYTYCGALFNVSLTWLKDGCQSDASQVADALFISVFGYDSFKKLKGLSA